MPRLLELRIPLPMSVEEYQVGMLWTVAQASKQETGGCQGIVVHKNEPFSDKPQLHDRYATGQYTNKTYYFEKKINRALRALISPNAFHANEEAWNAYPFCRTVVTSREYWADNFEIEILSLHLPDSGNGSRENVFDLSEAELKRRELIHLNVTDNEHLARQDQQYDIASYTSPCATHALAPPLGHGDLWQVNRAKMCVYKLVRIKIQKFGFQTLFESKAAQVFPRVIKKLHVQLVGTYAEWCCKTMEDVRALEAQVMKQLEQQFASGSVQGMVEHEHD